MHGDPREDEHVADEGAWDDRVERTYAVREHSGCEAPEYGGSVDDRRNRASVALAPVLERAKGVM